MKVKVFNLKALGKEVTGGNSAGVVVDADSFNEVQMQQIAAKVGVSETAFVQKSEKEDFKVRFFTPNKEIDMCGHATVATFYLLCKQGKIKPGDYTQEIMAGVLGIEIRPDELVFMEQTLPVFSEVIGAEEAAEAFGINPQVTIATGLPVQVVSTGLRDIFLPVDSRENLFKLRLNKELVKAINQRTNTVGFHAFTLDTMGKSAVAHCRNFAPLYDIDEEPATESSSGALACYLFKYGKIDADRARALIFEQGYAMNNPCEIYVALTVAGQEIKRVMAGGRAALVGELEVEI